MNPYDLKHLSDDEVLSGLAALVKKDSASKTKVRKILVEMDRRGLKPSGLELMREELMDSPAPERTGAE